jgi:hypothetical protein
MRVPFYSHQPLFMRVHLYAHQPSLMHVPFSSHHPSSSDSPIAIADQLIAGLLPARLRVRRR